MAKNKTPKFRILYSFVNFYFWSLINENFEDVYIAVQDAYGRQNKVTGLCYDPKLVCQAVPNFKTDVCTKYELPSCNDSGMCTGLLYRHARIGGCSKQRCNRKRKNVV